MTTPAANDSKVWELVLPSAMERPRQVVPSERGFLVFDEIESPRVRALEQQFLVEQTPSRTFDDEMGWMLGSFVRRMFDAPTWPQRRMSQEDLVRTLDDLRETFDLPAQTAAKLVGASPRRFYEWRRGARMPEQRLAEASKILIWLDRFSVADPVTTRELLLKQADEVATLLRSGNFDEFEGLAEKVRADRALLLEAQFGTTALDLPEGVRPRDVKALLRNKVFTAALQLLDRVVPSARVREQEWRLGAAAELADGFESLSRGDRVPENWSFLITLDDEALSSFQERANKALRRLPNERAWQDFLEKQAEAGFAAYDQHGLPPVEGSDAPDDHPQWVFAFSGGGIDPTTGQIRKAR